MKNDKKKEIISNEWSNRLLVVTDKLNAYTGGDLMHDHGISHSHSEMSSVPDSAARPLGLKLNSSSEKHRHTIESMSQDRNASDKNEYLPYYINFLAYRTKRSHSKVPDGIIVGFTGKVIPKGWVLYDSNNCYIRLVNSQTDRSSGGSNEHRHDVSHTHTWVSREPSQDNTFKAFAGDLVPPHKPIQNINQFMHTHDVNETIQQVFTINDSFFPPSYSVRFIKSITNMSKLPKGVVLPIVKNKKPWGWKRLISVDNQAKEKFVYAVIKYDSASKTFGSSQHSHRYQATHKLLLEKDTTNALKINFFNGPLTAISSHSHIVLVQENLETEPSNSLPQFVAFPFIIKK